MYVVFAQVSTFFREKYCWWKNEVLKVVVLDFLSYFYKENFSGNSKLNVEIGVEYQTFVIVIFFKCSQVLQFGAYSRNYKGALTQKRAFLLIFTTLNSLISMQQILFFLRNFSCLHALFRTYMFTFLWKSPTYTIIWKFIHFLKKDWQHNYFYWFVCNFLF